MRYNIENIEDQIVATLQSAFTVLGSQTVNVATHAGDLNPLVFSDPQLLEGVLPRLPFCFVQYQGKTAEMRSSDGTLYEHKLKFRIYVGASSLRTKQESQRSAYSMLRSVYDALHGKWPYYTGAPSTQTGGNALSGTIIASLTPMSCLLEAGGRDEMLIVNLPKIVVYQSDYTIDLIA